MINQLFTLLLFVFMLGLIWWVMTSIIPIPEPFLKMAQVLLVVILLFLIISIFWGGVAVPLIK